MPIKGYLFPYYRQFNGYSCGAEVLRMGVKALTGQKISRRHAIELLDCDPDGVSMSKLRSTFRSYGVGVSRLFTPTRRRIHQLLDQDKILVIDDNATYTNKHVIIIPARLTQRLLWVADPVLGIPTLRTIERIVRSSDRAFAIY